MHNCAFYFLTKYYKNQSFFNYVAVPEFFVSVSPQKIALLDLFTNRESCGVISNYRSLNAKVCEVCFPP